MSDFTYNLPDVGEGLSEGEIVHWHVAPGDTVAADQIIVDVQTDKAVVEIPAPIAGVMKSIGGDPGDMVPVGAMLAVIETEGTAPAAAAPAPDAEAPKSAVAPAPQAKGKRPLASPTTRKLAAELGVTLSNVAGSGPNGRITRDDVQRAAEGGTPVSLPAAAPAPAAPAIASPTGEDRVEPLRGLRRQIANSMTTAWREIPHILTTHEIDATNLVAARAALNEELATDGIKLSYLPLFVKACVGALKRFPAFNASLDMTRQEIIYRHRYNVGIATATPDGLIVPVVHDADRKSVIDIAREIEALAEVARTRKVTVEQLRGGTFTISNYGSYGGTFGTPIIRPPEVAIAGFGAIRDQVIPVDGAPAVRPNLTLVVSCDHRLNDGEHLGAFSGAIAAYLADPVRLFFGQT
ncbi:MAG: dihydrolipoamide acetyltransferase family protein [Alphaproteobacteria bacterium]|jgi:pyruvate/2-oxoglutarate dehydrogenase complex dihydrolipoamide acyltransferase (E2) component|nr:dihydrolipoamide acetyltransferase family protein [Alphaproteobacteria bacterium]MDP6238869.1 dihydrolipoamide acetyltransferase family protein [Alphaproteobacteria bacterium]MDP7173096.1 dihydrolipoamide acetyltransferase family protein [Alphaproteobacteria bacterium]MDP7233131.1 dihydrolipoamide acetyltransferase family protein [Alphaproteobacteria bacterium]MDP7486439.1 dihydrolipoamide acetyltransferase family protein [Alphaproteobacteria bacterium]|tara:strand:- start:1602 stop:2825 length:1224 start_codon:yes stop_codon:yes gene_type:complete